MTQLFYTYLLESTQSDFKGAENVPIKGVDDKRQITAKFVITATGEFLPMELIYPCKKMSTKLSILPNLPDYLHRKPLFQSNESYRAFWKDCFFIFWKNKSAKGLR